MIPPREPRNPKRSFTGAKGSVRGWGPHEGLGVPSTHWGMARGIHPNFTLHTQRASREETAVAGGRLWCGRGLILPHLPSLRFPTASCFHRNPPAPGRPLRLPQHHGLLRRARRPSLRSPLSLTGKRCGEGPGTLFPFSLTFFFFFLAFFWFFIETFQARAQQHHE